MLPDDNSKGSLSNIESAILSIAKILSPSTTASSDGWNYLTSETWAYASATTITVPSGAGSRYAVGDKIKLIQSSSTKYFYVVGITDTLLTVTGGSDYTVANSTISSPSYSKDATPNGFPDYFNWSPTWVNLTIGTGTNSARFTMKGRLVDFLLITTFNTGSAMGSLPTFTFPITTVTPPSSAVVPIAFGNLTAAAGNRNGFATWASSTTGLLRFWDVNNDLANVTSTAPATWAANTNNIVIMKGSIIAAA